jgi:hypothetical protein
MFSETSSAAFALRASPVMACDKELINDTFLAFQALNG